MEYLTEEKIREIKGIFGKDTEDKTYDLQLVQFFENSKMFIKFGVTENKIYNYIKLNPKTTQINISKQLNCSETYIQKTIKKFIHIGVMDKINGEYKIK